MQKVKRNLLLTLLAFMLAVVSAVSFMIAPTVKADDEVKENVVAEKTVKEKIEDWKKSIGEEEFSKILAKNAPSDSVDYSAYEKITDETITHLGGIIVAVRFDEVHGGHDLMNHADIEYYSSDSNLTFYIGAGCFEVVFCYGNGNEYVYISSLLLEVADEFLDSNEFMWVAYYIPNTIVFEGPADTISINMDEVVFDISNDRTDVFFYGVPETSLDEPDNPTPDEPGQGTDNPTPGSHSRSTPYDDVSDNISIKFLAIAGLFCLGLMCFIPFSKKKKNKK